MNLDLNGPAHIVVLAATLSSLVVKGGLTEESLQVQGNSYAMHSPLFELPVYLGLGLVCGGVSVLFSFLRDSFTELYDGKSWAKGLPVVRISPLIRPILGGTLCGLAALAFPQTLFSSYSTLDSLIAGNDMLPVSLLVTLLVVKLILTSFSLSSGLVGGVFAPSLFVHNDFILINSHYFSSLELQQERHTNSSLFAQSPF